MSDCKHCFHTSGSHREPGINIEINRCCHCNERKEVDVSDRELKKLLGGGFSWSEQKHGPYKPPPPMWS